MSLRRFALLLGILSLGTAGSADAQGDIIRGKITDPENRPLPGVTVTATSMDDQTSKSGTSDKNGVYTIIFSPASGSYLMTATAIGFSPAMPRELRRNADESFLVWDQKMTKQPVVLTAITTTGTRQRVDMNSGDNDPSRNGGVGSNDRDLNLADLMNMGMAGDIAAMAASLPGVTYIPGVDGGPSGFSILGLGADQNMTMLNGVALDGAGLPAEALAGGRVSTNPFNPAQGGFSGAQVSLRAATGNNFLTQSFGLEYNPSFLQFTDAAGQQLGQKYNSTRYSFTQGGPIVFQKHYYRATVSFSRRTNDLSTLLNTDVEGLTRLGVAQDSVNRFLGLVNGLGLPIDITGLPDNRVTDNVNASVNFTLNPTGTQTYTVTVSGGGSKNKAQGIGSTSVPTYGGESNSYNGSVSGQTQWYIGAGFLNNLSLGLSASKNGSDPYSFMPAASVRITSELEDGTTSISRLNLGGNPGYPTNSTNFSASINDALSWFSMNNKHQFQATGQFSYSQSTSDNSRNRLGTIEYNSLEDLQNNDPSRFTRLTNPQTRSSSSATFGFSLSDSYRPIPAFQIQYGFRGDANKYTKTPRFNEKVDSIFGVRNDHVPSAIYLSPRVGFSYTYGTGPQASAFQGAARGTRGTISGGLGMFQGRGPSIDNVVQNTGHPQAVQSISCIGDAVPIIDWAAFIADPNSIPNTCADGTGAVGFANTTPNVQLYDQGYVPSRSYRGSLAWSSTPAFLRNAFRLNVSGTYSYNDHQQGSVDLNFDPTIDFTLADELNRPVFAPTDRIVENTGTISSSAGRRTTEFNSVTSLRSDLKSKATQFSVSVNPAQNRPSGFRWSNLAYTWQSVRDLNRGFSGNTAGSPLESEWGRSSGDWRHQVRLSLSYTMANFFTVSLQPSLMSGTPFTPTVDQDINGDGRRNDRAFLFDPDAIQGSNPELANQMRSLIENANPSVRECLTKYLGTISPRNQCEGPWRFTMGAGLSIENQRLGLPQRARLTFGVQNPLTGMDALLHGWDNLKGWGVNPAIDATMLSVRGFDRATGKFDYEVNERFGATNAQRTQRTNPFILTMRLTYDLAPEREKQQLNLNLRQGRADTRNKWSEQQFRNTYTGMIRNPFAWLLQQADTLKITEEQADSIAMLNRNWTRFQDSLWTPVARYLATLPNEYDADEAWERVKQTWNVALDRLAIVGPAAKSMLSRDQLNLVPQMMMLYLDETMIRAIKPGNAAGRARLGGG